MCVLCRPVDASPSLHFDAGRHGDQTHAASFLRTSGKYSSLSLLSIGYHAPGKNRRHQAAQPYGKDGSRMVMLNMTLLVPHLPYADFILISRAIRPVRDGVRKSLA